MERPASRAAILTADGVGEWATASLGHGSENQLDLLSEIHFPHSVGLLYSAFTYYTGFKVNSAEYKVMGLAPYGEPKYVSSILDHLIDLKEDGSFKLDMSYFNYCAGLTMTNEKFHRLFGGPPRKPETAIRQRDMDLARSIQAVTEEIMLRMARYARKLTGEENLCLSGGVALNCVANGRIVKDGPFKHVWIQPAAGDAGGALGAALIAWHHYLDQPRKVNGDDAQMGSFLGPRFSNAEIETFLNRERTVYEQYETKELIRKTAGLINGGNVVGWFQDRMEFGPRALGARSIIGDARNADMQSRMNLKIKFRESFRPFAPSVLEDDASEWFDINSKSPYMLLVAGVDEKHRINSVNGERRGFELLKERRSDLPAVTHVDYSARLQTVDAKRNPLYYDLLKEFKKQTACSVIVNTSFNVRGEPIVCTPEDAFRCFMRTEMDYLVIGNFILDKRKQKKVSLAKESYAELD